MSKRIKSFVALVLVALTVAVSTSGCQIKDCYDRTGMGTSCLYEAVKGK